MTIARYAELFTAQAMGNRATADKLIRDAKNMRALNNETGHFAACDLEADARFHAEFAEALTWAAKAARAAA